MFYVRFVMVREWFIFTDAFYGTDALSVDPKYLSVWNSGCCTHCIYEKNKEKLKEEKQRIFEKKKKTNENIKILTFLYFIQSKSICVCTVALRSPSMIDVKYSFSRMCGGGKKNRCENEKLAAINLSMPRDSTRCWFLIFMCRLFAHELNFDVRTYNKQ